MTERTLESIRPGVRELLKRPAIPIVVIRRLPGRASGCGERRTWPAIDAGQRLPVGIDRKLLTALSVLRLVDRGALQDGIAWMPPPGFRGGSRRGDAAMLFTHTSGLQGAEPGRPEWHPASRPPLARERP